ncbi:hypothetical protein FACS1894211_02040 [Clostridia bacterium]|nr:hypothetical protein FACS1894211_02040 [Clostridia bacterium]
MSWANNKFTIANMDINKAIYTATHKGVVINLGGNEYTPSSQTNGDEFIVTATGKTNVIVGDEKITYKFAGQPSTMASATVSGATYQDGETILIREATVLGGSDVNIALYAFYFGHEDLKKTMGFLPGDITADSGHLEKSVAEWIENFDEMNAVEDWLDYFNIYIRIKEYAVSGVPNPYDEDEIFYPMCEFLTDEIPGITGDPAYNTTGVFFANGPIGGYGWLPDAAVGGSWTPGGAGQYSVGHVGELKYWMAHEFLGHSFAGFGDEYFPGGEDEGIYTEDINETRHKNGWSLNLSDTDDLALVPWAEFITRYSGAPGSYYSLTNIGVFEGGLDINSNVWRSEEDGVMNGGGQEDLELRYMFSPYHRYLIWDVIMTKAGIEHDVENFFKWDIDGKEMHVVNFESDGQIFARQIVNDGDNAAAPSLPTKSGYEFDGWNESLDNITATQTITAKWKLL